MDIEQIELILKRFGELPINRLSLKQGEFSLKLSKAAPQVISSFTGMGDPTGQVLPQEINAPPLEDPSHVVTSPIVGTFYMAPNPTADPFVQVGDRVKKGQVLCIVEAMKLMNEIQSDVDGVIVQRFVENAAPVEFGQKLFSIQI